MQGLKALSLDLDRPQDIDFTGNITGLEKLEIRGCAQRRSLGFIARLEELTDGNIDWDDVETLNGLVGLKSLWVSHKRVCDSVWSQVRLPHLKVFDLDLCASPP